MSIKIKSKGVVMGRRRVLGLGIGKILRLLHARHPHDHDLHRLPHVLAVGIVHCPNRITQQGRRLALILDPKWGQLALELAGLRGVWGLMVAKHRVIRRQRVLRQPHRDALVRRQHELLDDPVGGRVRLLLDSVRIGTLQSQRRDVQVQGPVLEAQLSHFAADIVQQGEILGDLLPRAAFGHRRDLKLALIQVGLHLVVGHPAHTLQHRPRKSRLGILAQRPGVAVQPKKNRKSTFQLVKIQRAQVVTQRAGQHREHAVGEVHGGAPPLGFVVDERSSLDVVGDVCNMDTDFHPIIVDDLDVYGIIQILGRGRVDTHHPLRSKILALARLVLEVPFGVGDQGLDFFEDVLGVVR
mmetsp:Transcript_46618/g.123133  ORF Transcript_46618/g.123133 Transcript_46618/m.123133 type:complete len:354 (-) Transcript_46618:1510-2571(-)